MSITWCSEERQSIKLHDIEPQSNFLQHFSDDQIYIIFEIKRCVDWVLQTELKNIALQFPDNLLQYSAIVSFMLESFTKQCFSILGDTSFGECCVDDVAAQHIDADGLIHFGHTCLTATTNRIPVLYIFTTYPISNFEALLKKIEAINYHLSTVVNADLVKISLFYDVQYHAVLLKDKQKLPDYVFLCPPVVQNDSITKTSITICGRLTKPPNSGLGFSAILYVGSNEHFAAQLALATIDQPFFIFDPNSSSSTSSVSSSFLKQLKRRQYYIEQTRDARRIGILVGTLGASQYREIIDSCRKTISAAGKHPYTFLLGKPSIPKLANFSEIEVFVWISCPENSFLDSKSLGFMRPIVTPFELDVALNTARYSSSLNIVTDFRRLLPGGADHVPLNIFKDDISLISGELRPGCRQKSENEFLQTGVLTSLPPSTISVLPDGGAEFLSQRLWRGLDPKLGQTTVSKTVMGQKGIAIAYEGEG